MEPTKKTRILAIVAGVGTITALYALTHLPDRQDRIDITVYQLGWRLGGKGASGRNAAHGQRIEEHGLHVWGGFYENAFRNLRDCYGELRALACANPTRPWLPSSRRSSRSATCSCQKMCRARMGKGWTGGPG